MVCFESSEEDEGGMHAAAAISKGKGAFPPNTLFRLKEVKEAGEWTAPNGLCVQQRLLVVTATYRAPPSSEESTGAADASKMTGAVLSYADRQAYVAGLDGLLPRKPMLTMQQEFARSDAWVDWKGAHYTVRQEWDAHAHETCTCTFHMKHAHAHAHAHGNRGGSRRHKQALGCAARLGAECTPVPGNICSCVHRIGQKQPDRRS